MHQAELCGKGGVYGQLCRADEAIRRRELTHARQAGTHLFEEVAFTLGEEVVRLRRET